MQYTSKRFSILNALVDKLKEINGTGEFLSNVYDNVHPRMLFWDEVAEYPAIHTNLGSESRVYQGGGYKERYLVVTIRAYVKDEEPQQTLESLLEDIETVIENNGRLAYTDSRGAVQFTQDMLIISIDTDEGALAPLGVGEIVIQVRY